MQADVDRLEAAVAAAEQQLARHNQELSALEERRRAVQVSDLNARVHISFTVNRCGMSQGQLLLEGMVQTQQDIWIPDLSAQADYNGQVREHAKTVQQLETVEAAREAAEQQVHSMEWQAPAYSISVRQMPLYIEASTAVLRL